MTPSPSSPTRPSRGWTRSPDASSGTRSLARDAVQDALVRAWRDLPGLRDPATFDALSHRRPVNAAIDAVRRRRRRVIEVELWPVHDPAHPRRDRPKSPTGTTSHEPSGDWSLEQRAVIVLHYYLGLPLQDAAATLGIPIGTAKSRLHRSLHGAAVDGPGRRCRREASGGRLS